MAFEIDFIEGFDAYGDDVGALGDRWIVENTTKTYPSSTTHRGASGSSLFLVGYSLSPAITMSLKKSYRCVVAGFAIRYRSDATAPGSNDEGPLCLMSGATKMITLALEESGLFTLRRGSQGGVILATGTSTLLSDVWYYLELKVFIDDTLGAFEFKIDGVTEFSGSSVDTNASATVDSVNRTAFFVPDITNSLYDFWVDDVYLNGDTTTNTAGGFLGDTRVTVLRPDADGTYEQWTLSTGVDAFALIDEDLPSTVDYLESSTAAQKYSVSHTAFTGTGTIHAVEQCVFTSTPDNTTRNLYPICRSNSVDYQNPTVRGRGGAYVTSVYENNPNTATAWTDTTLNAAEFGLEIV